jgi:hypothetical protein
MNAADLRTWTLTDLISDPHALYRVPTIRLERLYAATAHAVIAPDMHDLAREQLQTLRVEIAQTLRRRRLLDQEEQPEPCRLPQDAPDDQDRPQPAQSDADAALRLLRGLIQLATGNGHQDDDGPRGGTKVSRPTAPKTGPKGPNSTAVHSPIAEEAWNRNTPPVDIGF